MARSTIGSTTTGTASPPVVSAMARTWDRLAADDPMHYIVTTRSDWTAESFFESGRAVVSWALEWAGPALRRRRMLEIGCGIGRTAMHFAEHFEQVDGIDVSAEMIRTAAQHGMPSNVTLRVGSGGDLAPYADGRFDLVFSTLVFQHIPADAVVARYLRETRRVLAHDGVAILQFDTRPSGLLGRLYARLPGTLLGPDRGRFVRRYRRTPASVRSLLTAAGLAVDAEHGAATASHYWRLRPATEERR